MTTENENVQGVEDTTPVSSTPKRNLGITKETSSGSGIPIGAPIKLDKSTEIFPGGHQFPIATLTEVSFDPIKPVKRNDEITPTPVLNFVLTTTDGKKFTHVEFPVDDEDAEFEKKHAQLQQRIKHFFVETIGENKFEEGSMDGADYPEFFNNVAKAFNKNKVVLPAKEGDEVKHVSTYTRNKVYFKVTYYKDRLQLPLYPNFVQKAFKGTPSTQVPCELLINPTYDKLVPVAKVKSGDSGAYAGRDTTFASNLESDYPDLP